MFCASLISVIKIGILSFCFSIIILFLDNIFFAHLSIISCEQNTFYEIVFLTLFPRSGYTASVEELLQFVHARVLDTERLRGGIVLVDKLPKDPSGKLFVSLSKFDAAVEGMDEDFCKRQHKVAVTPVSWRCTVLFKFF